MDAFYSDKRASDGKQSQCKNCMKTAANMRNFGVQYERTGRAGHLRRQYGLTVQQYGDLVASQDGCCIGCGKRPSGRLHIDHDHETGLVRGLLCTDCNRALGLVRDNPATLRRLATYLEVGRLGTAEGMLSAMRGLLGVSGRPNLATRDYAKRHGDAFLRAPWCNIAITYAARGSGNAKAVLPNGDRAFTVWHAEDGRDLGRWYAGTAENIRKHARPAAIVFFDWGETNSIPHIDHVGLCEVNLGDGRLQTIEANTGDACKRRVRGPDVIAGFWNPPYEEDNMPSAKEVADAVYERLSQKLPADVWAVREGYFAEGETLDPKTGLRQLWAYAKDAYAKNREILARLDVQSATIQALAEALAARDESVDVEALVAQIEAKIGAALEGVSVRLEVGE